MENWGCCGHYPQDKKKKKTFLNVTGLCFMCIVIRSLPCNCGKTILMVMIKDKGACWL